MRSLFTILILSMLPTVSGAPGPSGPSKGVATSADPCQLARAMADEGWGWMSLEEELAAVLAVDPGFLRVHLERQSTASAKLLQSVSTKVYPGQARLLIGAEAEVWREALLNDLSVTIMELEQTAAGVHYSFAYEEGDGGPVRTACFPVIEYREYLAMAYASAELARAEPATVLGLVNSPEAMFTPVRLGQILPEPGRPLSGVSRHYRRTCSAYWPSALEASADLAPEAYWRDLYGERLPLHVCVTY